MIIKLPTEPKQTMSPYAEAYEVVESIVQAIDAKYPKWDLYRSASHAWIFHAGDVTLSSGDLVNTLIAARDHVPLPKIPRKPELFREGDFAPLKTSSGWTLAGRDGGRYGIHVKTKKEAAAFYERLCRESAAKVKAWEEAHGDAVATGIEGVTFKWDRNHV